MRAVLGVGIDISAIVSEVAATLSAISALRRRDASPATRVGDARVRAGTRRGARGASQVVAAPDAHHVRDVYVPPSTPAAMCANPSSPPEI